MPTKTYVYSCPTARIRVFVTTQTFSGISGIGDDVSHSYTDHDCSNHSRCDHRHDNTCAVLRLNTGALIPQRK